MRNEFASQCYIYDPDYTLARLSLRACSRSIFKFSPFLTVVVSILAGVTPVATHPASQGWKFAQRWRSELPTAPAVPTARKPSFSALCLPSARPKQ